MANYKLISAWLLSVYFLQFTECDNGVVREISDICIDCLKRVQPSPDEECIPHPSLVNYEQCGPFKMTILFYEDCSKYTNFTDEWDTWEECYKDEDCSRECVRAYHNHYGESCIDSMRDVKDLTCADYGQIHFVGPLSCGQKDQVPTEIITNMSLLCGCQTIHESRENCLVIQGTGDPLDDPLPPANSQRYIGAIVGVSLTAIVIIIVTIALAVYCTHRKSRGLIAHSGDKKVVSQSFRNQHANDGVEDL